MERLQELRAGIDRADEELVHSLARRLALVGEIAETKAREGLPALDAERERLVLRRMAERARELSLDIRLVERLVREIIRHSRASQTREPKRTGVDAAVRAVAYQGAPGAFSWELARRQFGEDVEVVGCRTFAETLALVRAGACERAVLPVHNSVAGAIHAALDLLAEGDLAVVAEEYLPVNQCLIGQPGASCGEIRRVFSHPVALQQCGKFLAAHEELEVVAWYDTAGAAQKIAADADPAQAAIAGEEAAAAHGLAVLKAGIADHPDNQTRFWTIAREPAVPSGNTPCKTSLVLTTEHREGALVRCLQSFAAFGVNMLRLESRPLPDLPALHRFYLDIEGSTADERLQAALDAVRRYAVSLIVLGSYERDLAGLF